MAVASYIPLRELFNTWDDGLITAADGDSILDKVGIQDFKIAESGGTTTVSLTVAFEGELGLSIPGVEGLGVYLGQGGSVTTLKVEADVSPSYEVRLPELAATLRLPASILKPVTKQDDTWVTATLADGSPAPYEITLSGISVSVSAEGDVDLTFPAGAPAIALSPAMIGDSGIVIESDEIGFYFSSAATLPAGAPAGFKGIFIESARIHLPEGLSQLVPDQLAFSNCYIGTGGFTGEITTTWNPELSGSLSGITFGLSGIELGFKQNALVKSAITGSLTLPFFDQQVEVEICIAANGNWAVELSGASGGLLTLTKPDILSLEVDSLGFGQEDGLFTVVLSGQITPAFGGLDWPTVEMKELSIDAEGNVRVAGGWLDLGDQGSLDLHGFQLELTKIGFGNETDGSKWVGFMGGIRFVDGMAGARVEGLKIGWDASSTPSLSLEGVGIEFEIPETLRLSGYVAYSDDGGPRFAGQVKLSLIALGLEIDAILVIGTDETQTPAFTYFAIYLGVELPAGIPLWATGLGLYGLAGLFTINYTPDKAEDEEWYEDWYKASPEGVTDLIGKWAPEDGAFALGGGVTIGTVADNGYTFSGRLLLVIVLPGPIIMLEGRANFLAKRSALSEDPIFRALAVLDGRAGTLEFGLGAQWKYDKTNAYIVDIGGDVEVFFDFNDASAWHLYLGQEDPVEKRIRALIFTFLEANSYFMIDPTQVATGAWVGIDKHWEFGPAEVTLEAWIEGNAVLSWKPVQFHGDAWLHGAVGVSLFGFGFDLSADARLSIDTPSPYYIYAGIEVEVGLPWPFDDFSVTAELEWTKTTYSLPVPMPLAEVAIEHLKTSDSWLVPRETQLPSGSTQPLLLPEYSDGEGFIGNSAAAATAAEEAAARLASPVVPLDGRPHLTFGRAVHDAAMVGVNPQPPSPSTETVGEETFKFSLNSIKLQKWNGSDWETVAAAPKTGSEEQLFGSWAPVPTIPSTGDSGDPATAQTKLWLWSINPYDYTGKSSRAWDDWFGGAYQDYPCVPEAEQKEQCYDLEAQTPGSSLTSAFTHPDNPGVLFSWSTPHTQTVVDDPPYAVEGRTHSLFFKGLKGQEGLTVQLREPATEVVVLVAHKEFASATAYTNRGTQIGPVSAGNDHKGIRLSAPEGEWIRTIWVEGYNVWFMGICTWTYNAAEIEARAEMASHMLSELSRWSDEGAVFEPDTEYRLEIKTSVERSSGSTTDLTEYAYFRTEGPPGLAEYSTPVQWPGAEPFSTALSDLGLYVASTVPEPGQKPVYRAYDLGVAFNETYVELMYRLAGRDLGLYLYDSNSQPLRDAAGRLLVVSNAWGKGTRTLTESEERWVYKVNQSDCAALDPETFSRTDTTTLAGGQVLNPDLVHSARLIPLLLHEDFSGGSLDGWTVVDESGTSGGPSAWAVGSEADDGGGTVYFVTQTANLYGGTTDGADPVKPGTLLVRGDASWTDYRVSALLRSGDDDAIGLVFRRQDDQNFYRFSMDRQRRYRRLVKVTGGTTTVLAEDSVPYQPDRDYEVTIEAIGDSLAVYIDGEAFCAVDDADVPDGGIGLYCWANDSSRFADVRVDDFRADAPVVYAFTFTTSLFANFHHQIHSFDDETWPAAAGDSAGLASALASATVPGATPGAPGEVETAAYEQALEAVFGNPTRQLPERLTATRIDASAWLVESPEPIDWERTTLAVSRAARDVEPGEVPAELKLTGATFGATATPNDETVSLVLRDAFDPADHQIETYQVPGPVAVPDQTLLLSERFAGETGGTLFVETFGPNALDLYSIVDEGNLQGPSQWVVTGGYIAQMSNIRGGIPFPLKGTADVLKKGTMAVTGDPAWTDYRLTVAMTPMDNDAIGVLVRYTDPDNYYRLSMDQQGGYRRLVKRYNGRTTTLWEEQKGFSPGTAYTMAVEVCGSRITGYLNDTFLFSLEDAALKAGAVGLYCSAHKDARFTAIQAEVLAAQPVLWYPELASLSEWTATGSKIGNWTVSGGKVKHAGSKLSAGTPLKGLFRPAAYLTGGDPGWSDCQLCVRLSASNSGAMGAVIRYADNKNFYRFTMDRSLGRRALVKVEDGVSTVLWQSAGSGYSPGTAYDLTLRAEGTVLSGYVNGNQLFEVTDGAIAAGKVGLYATSGTKATFSRVLVGDRTRRVGDWIIVDEGDQEGPSRWLIDGEALAQTSNIWGASGGSFGDAGTAGTCALAGESDWTDYRLRVRMRADDDDLIGVIVRYQDRDNHFRLTFDAQRSKRRLTRKSGGTVATLWEEPAAYVPGQPFTVTLDAVGERLTGYVDGARIFDVSTSGPASGTVGLFCAGNDSARFEWVSVAEPPPDSRALLADRFSEGDTSAWTIHDDGTVGGPSHWAVDTGGAGSYRQTSSITGTALLGSGGLGGLGGLGGVLGRSSQITAPGTRALAGDAAWTDYILSLRLSSSTTGAMGAFFRYQDDSNFYRFAVSTTYRRLVRCKNGKYQSLWSDQNGVATDKEYLLTITASNDELRGYIDGVPVFVVEDPEHGSGRIGLYASGNPGVSFSSVRVWPTTMLYDGFLPDERFDGSARLKAEGAESGVIGTATVWTSADEPDASTGGPSAWAIGSGALTQTAAITGTTASGIPAGTYVTPSVDPGADYRVSVRLQTGAGGAIGVLFRYTDADNHYSFAMDRSAPYRRLYQVQGGVATLIWSDSKAIAANREYVFTADCQGDAVAGYLDGVELFRLGRAALSEGTVGLWCSGNTGAVFREVRVGAADWSFYYRFEPDEEPLAAGTRIAVHAGNVAAATGETAGIEHRYAAGDGETDNRRLEEAAAGSGARLRVVAPDGTGGHDRVFLPAGEFTPVSAGILRRADGTGLLISPTGADTLSSGVYRLAFTYRRDNTASDPDSTVLSQAGDTSDEVATIDLPWETR